MFDIGRICMKIAGRDSNKPCVIIDVVDAQHVMIAGVTRRRKCNVKHLEPTEKVVKIKKNAAFSEVAKVFSELGYELKETTPKKATTRPKKARVKKQRELTQKKNEAKPKVQPKAKESVKKDGLNVKPDSKQSVKASVAKPKN